MNSEELLARMVATPFTIPARGLDDCPTCGRYIIDTDITGCETEYGQRYCIRHAPIRFLIDLGYSTEDILAMSKTHSIKL